LRTPRFLAVLLLALAALVVAACGGSDEEDAASSEDVNTLLTQTFTGDKKMESGKLAMTATIEAEGAGAEQLGGPIKVSLTGPFDATDEGSMPKFALEAAVDSAQQDLEAGATSTGDKGFVSFQGTEYVVSDLVFQQFRTQYEQARKQAESQQEQGQSLATLGLDPRKWLVDPQNAGEAEVGDTETIKITAGIDVAKLLDDANKALQAAASLGAVQGQQLPERLTEEQKRQAVEAIKDPRIEIYTGADDKIMRRMVLSLGIADKASDSSGTIGFDVAITDLNEPQEIDEPENAQPFDKLAAQLQSILPALGGAPSSGSGSGGSGAAASEDLEAYSECLTKAGNDVEKARKCADLLAP
jgi:hypothetical protein